MHDLEIVQWILDTLERGAEAHESVGERGLTKWGVTRVALADYLRVPVEQVSDDDIAALTRQDCELVWHELFVVRAGFYQVVDWQLRLACVQLAGHIGATAAAKVVQRVARVPADGVVGPATITALNALPPERAKCWVLASHLEYCAATLEKRPEKMANAPGWMRRVATSLRVA